MGEHGGAVDLRLPAYLRRNLVAGSIIEFRGARAFVLLTVALSFPYLVVG